MLKYIVLSPLMGAAINGLLGRRLGERLVRLIGCGSVGVSAALALYVFWAQLLPLEPEQRLITEMLYDWIDSGLLHAEFAFRLDPLSGIYIVFVTFVGFWIHVFGVGYMRGEPGTARFFATMNLFMFMMLVLVLADNFVVMFVGWEGVGLCSYLLIGHYFKRDYAADAAKKAFIVNRIGDVGFALGIILSFATFGSVRFGEVLDAARQSPPDDLWAVGVVTAIGLLLFVGATGKSAQIPLYVWLPDAMAGPTPVSALIHAATMVTAGVYMVARTSEIYVHAPTAMFVVAIVGGVTAFFTATIALGQSNIKKVLAYSTISQLGYMFMACGVGAFTAGIFHVVTHAFFKALLFLGAGSVILALHHNEDMREMGGLKKYLPVTYRTFWIAWLAICGIVPFAGFFSKDEILWRAFSTPALPPGVGKFLWVLGVVTALLTVVYMTRLMVMTFEGEERVAKSGGHEHGHGSDHAPRESPLSMTLPLLVLAFLSVVGGFIGVSEGLSFGLVPNWFEHFLHPAIARLPEAGPPASHALEIGLALGTLAVVVVVLMSARRYYLGRPLWSPPRLLENKYWVDEAYNRALVQPINGLSVRVLWQFIDVKIIDGVVNGTATVVRLMAGGLRRVQTGFVRSYAVMILLGALMVIGYFLFAKV
jgi:NADH-quinone oxidoreductase subunit L